MAVSTQEVPEGTEALVAEFVHVQLQEFSRFLGSDHARNVCVDVLRKAGCSPKIALAGFALFKTLIFACDRYGSGPIGAAAQQTLVRLIDRVPLFATMLRAAMRFVGKALDAAAYRQVLLDRVKKFNEERGTTLHNIPVSQATDENVLDSLNVAIEFSDLREKLRRSFDEVFRHVEDALASDREPRLQLPQPEADSHTGVQTLRFSALFDEFIGRENETAKLEEFLFARGEGGHPINFRWLVLAARGGEGKSRLAFDFAQTAQTAGWRAGEPISGELRKLEIANWLPRLPTLLVLDYRAQVWTALPHLLERLVYRADEFEHPVRVLAISREPTDELMNRLMPPNRDGVAIRKCAYGTDGKLLLKPLDQQSLIKLMRERFIRRDRSPPPDKMLVEAARRLDSNADIAGNALPPRALFAAMAAESLLTLATQSDEVSWPDFVHAIEKETTFRAFIDRDRRNFWKLQDPADEQDEETRLALHENLLIVSTMTLGQCPPASIEKAVVALGGSGLIPDSRYGPTSFDRARFRRMTGHEGSTLAALEPDIVGEYFVIDRLNSTTTAGVVRLLIDAAWHASPWNAATFALRAFNDFPHHAIRHDYFLPSPGIADEWAVKMLRTIIDDLGFEFNVYKRPSNERESQDPALRTEELEKRRKIGIRAVVLFDRLRGIVDKAQAQSTAMFGEAAEALRTVCYVASVLEMPELEEVDPRFDPKFTGNQEIAQSRRRSRIAFRIAQESMVQPQRADIGALALPAQPVANELETPPEGAVITLENAVGFLRWLRSQMDSVQSDTAKRAHREVARSLSYFCYTLGDHRTCQEIEEEALARIKSENRHDPAVLAKELGILAAAVYQTSKRAQAALETNDGVTLKEMQDRTKRAAFAALSVQVTRLDSEEARANFGKLLRNASITLWTDEQFLGRCVEVLPKSLATHRGSLDLGFGFAYAASSYARQALLFAHWENPALPILDANTKELSARLSQWAQHLHATMPQVVFDIDRHQKDKVYEVSRSGVKVLLVASTMATTSAEADTLLGRALDEASVTYVDYLSESDLADLGIDAAPLWFVSHRASEEMRARWFNWLMEPVRARAALEGFATWLRMTMPNCVNASELFWRVANEFGNALDAPNRPGLIGGTESSHEIIAAGIIELCSGALAAADKAQFETLAELFEGAGRKRRNEFALHRLRLATLRLDLCEARGELEKIVAANAPPKGGDEETQQAFLEFLVSASFASERLADLTLSEGVAEQLIQFGNRS